MARFFISKKCKFAYDKCVFLGHEISKKGCRPPQAKLEIIKAYPIPKNQMELKRALGLFNWFRKFIPNYSAVASPLYALLKKNVPFKWTPECETSFQQLKDLLVQSDALAFPRYDREFRLAVDTCCRGIGYMLYQYDDDGETRVVRFGSKGLTKWQRAYGPTKLELLGLVTAVLDCASYLRGRHFVCECDHQTLQPIFMKKLKGQIYERWLAILQQFDLDIVYKPASEMVVPDSLSRTNEYPEVMSASPEEEDPFFPYISERPGRVRFITPDNKVVRAKHLVGKIHVFQNSRLDTEYDADTEDNIERHKVRVTPYEVNSKLIGDHLSCDKMPAEDSNRTNEPQPAVGPQPAVDPQPADDPQPAVDPQPAG